MKWLRTMIIFDRGGIVQSEDWASVHESYVRAIQSIEHPKGSGIFKIRKKIQLPKTGKTVRWKRNGVGYIRREFLKHLTDVEKWQKEVPLDFKAIQKNLHVPLALYPSGEEYTESVTTGFGKFDFVRTAPNGLRVALEWETGNISSSHRSVNKLCVCLNAGLVQAGVVIVPSRLLYAEITDRIGNISELSGYLSLWEAAKVRVERGLLALSVVEHDELTTDETFPFLKAGKDGRAKKAKKKTKTKRQETKSALEVPALGQPESPARDR